MLYKMINSNTQRETIRDDGIQCDLIGDDRIQYDPKEDDGI